MAQELPKRLFSNVKVLFSSLRLFLHYSEKPALNKKKNVINCSICVRSPWFPGPFDATCEKNPARELSEGPQLGRSSIRRCPATVGAMEFRPFAIKGAANIKMLREKEHG